MRASRSSLGTVLVPFSLPFLGAILAGLLSLPFPAALLPVLVGAGLGAWLSIRAQHPADPAPHHTPAAPPAESCAKAAQAAPIPANSSTHPTPDADPKLRHDIRNILSPAMLAAEQLGTSTDPQVLKAARTIDESLDRALLRLKQKPQPHA